MRSTRMRHLGAVRATALPYFMTDHTTADGANDRTNRASYDSPRCAAGGCTHCRILLSMRHGPR
jgi:hypothetical protein